MQNVRVLDSTKMFSTVFSYQLEFILALLDNLIIASIQIVDYVVLFELPFSANLSS